MAILGDALIMILSHLLSLDLLQAGAGVGDLVGEIQRSLPTHSTTVVKFLLQTPVTDKGLIAWIMDQISYYPYPP